jgi:hypothetical protein
MSVYTVHGPPLRAAAALAELERFVFVRDGFYVWAFLLTPLWMLWHRLWLVLVAYVVFTAVLDGGLRFAGASAVAITLAGLSISILIGLEAATLRRFTLRRRRWRNVGVVSGDDLEDAERRFFDAWLRRAPVANGPPAPAMPGGPVAPAAPPAAYSSEPPGIIGLFPEPGAQR